MSRPHEDRERHTLVDHRPGGSLATFPTGSWVAIGIARVTAERNAACIAAYETLIEKARTSNIHADPAVVFASQNGRRAVAMVGLRGHDGFRHLEAAWDDHHRNAQHRVIAESVSFALYEVAASIGAADIDSASHDAYGYERVERSISRVSELFASLSPAPDFRGATILHGDVDVATVIVSRFVSTAAYDSFRNGREARNVLGSSGEPGESGFEIHPRKTFALPGAART